MKVQVGDENSRALNLIKKEIKDGVKIIIRIGGEEFGVLHVENAADCRELDRFEGEESGGVIPDKSY